MWVPIISNKALEIQKTPQHLMRARKQHLRGTRMLNKQHQDNSNHRPMQKVTSKVTTLTNSAWQTQQNMKGPQPRRGTAPLMGEAASSRRTRRGADQGSGSTGGSASNQGLRGKRPVTKLIAIQAHTIPAGAVAKAAAAVVAPAAVVGAAGVVQGMRAKVRRLVGKEVGPACAARAEARGAGAGKEKVRQRVV
jgi:hypothetical protein